MSVSINLNREKRKRFDLLRDFISNKANLDYRKYNDTPFIIVPHKVQEQNKVKEDISHLKSRLNKNDTNYLHINLYELSIELLNNEHKDLQYFLEVEEKRDKTVFLEEIQSIVTAQRLAEKISDRCRDAQAQLLLISGVGEVFPYLRLSKLLENMAVSLKESVVLIFFPGIYAQSNEQGTYLKLFDRLDYDHHYRAFNIEDLNL